MRRDDIDLTRFINIVLSNAYIRYGRYTLRRFIKTEEKKKRG